MLSNKEIVCPNNLLNAALRKKGVKAGIVNAGKPLPMLSVQDAVNENLIMAILSAGKGESKYNIHISNKKIPKIKGIKEIMYPGQNKYKRFKTNSKKKIKILTSTKKDLEILKN